MKRADKNWAHFEKTKVLKKSKFSKRFINVSWSPNQIFFTNFFFWKVSMKNDFETQNFEIFDEVVHNFGKPDKVIMY